MKNNPMKSNPIHPSRNSAALLTVAALAMVGALGAQEKPAPATSVAASTNAAPAPAPGTLDSLFNTKLPDAIGKSKISFNTRLRWEHADQTALRESDALTLRTRFGLTTAPLYGFQGMIEGENISVLGPKHNFNAAGSNPGGAGRTIIADPATTELNQAWLSYANWDTVLKGGRQRITLDNQRFIGDVGWRQNMQTFDAVSLENKSVKNLSLYYAYVWDVNRVFGNVSGLPALNTDFASQSHLFNASYSGWKYGKITGYSYLLDLHNDAPASPGNSTATYGGYVAGGVPLHKKLKLEYRAEFAWQTDYARSPLSYHAEYYNVEAGLNIKPVVFGAGYEVLGTGNSQGFRTPLATLHAFNGWADVFLNTPASGLRDLYAFGQVTLPADIPLRFVYHKYDADSGGADFGQEYDVVASKKLGKHWTVLAKYAYYDGKNAPFAPAGPIDVDKFWLQIEFNY